MLSVQKTQGHDVKGTPIVLLNVLEALEMQAQDARQLFDLCSRSAWLCHYVEVGKQDKLSVLQDHTQLRKPCWLQRFSSMYVRSSFSCKCITTCVFKCMTDRPSCASAPLEDIDMRHRRTCLLHPASLSSCPDIPGCEMMSRHIQGNKHPQSLAAVSSSSGSRAQKTVVTACLDC